MKIVVLAGGLSTERDVSLVTGRKVTEALRKNGHKVILLDVFMGYSDNTNFCFPLTTICDVASIYGINITDFGNTTHPL